MFTSVSGEVTQRYVSRDYLGQESRGVDVEQFSSNIYGGLAGLGYTMFANSRISLRGELDAGLAYVAGVVGDNDMTASTGFETKMENGFGTVVRATASAILNVSDWQIGVSLGQTNVQDASAATVGVSIAKSINLIRASCSALTHLG
jgi:hypothetical protein